MKRYLSNNPKVTLNQPVGNSHDLNQPVGNSPPKVMNHLCADRIENESSQRRSTGDDAGGKNAVRMTRREFVGQGSEGRQVEQTGALVWEGVREIREIMNCDG